MKIPSDHMRTLKRRVDFLKSREHQNSFDLAELGALEWAIVNLQPAPVQEPVLKDNSNYRYDPPVAEPVAIPEGFSLVAVKGFDELMYWLDRCERKGHLENCPDLIEPYEAFDYRTIDTTPPAAQRPWVGLTDEEQMTLLKDSDGKTRHWLVWQVEAKLKERNQ